ncbi:MAG: L-asparaginase [Anaerosporomusa subterranea]|jgi:L-asparaginase II|nr:L-asparaginase [Anaerosporomusa subterranea]
MMKPLVAVTRNGYIESLHWGLVCAVDADGKVVFAIGDSETKMFFRSSAKPIQAIPMIQAGAASAYDFTAEEIALACASHTGTPSHQKVTASMLAKIGLVEENLHCGIMRPYDAEEDRRLLTERLEPSLLHCSCSGKHAAMLALAKYRGHSVDNYHQSEHPVQQEIIQMVARFANEDQANITVATDGCGAPIYLLPARKIAMSYARLVQWAQNEHHQLHEACRTVVQSMTAHPEMVSGEKEFCAALMRNTGGRIVAKVGAEAVYCLGIRDRQIGICVKIGDGNERAVYPAVLQVLRELGGIKDDEFSRLEEWYHIPVLNNLGQRVGEIRPALGAVRLGLSVS